MKVVLKLENLNCAHCAAKIEKEIGELKEVDKSSLDFVSQKLTIHSHKDNMEEVIKKATDIINKKEPDVKVVRDADNDNHTEHKKGIIPACIGGGLFALGILCPYEQIKFWIFLAAYIITGKDVLLKAVKNLFRAAVLDENFLMSIATVGAFLTKNYTEGVAVMLLYQTGELFQGYAVERSRRSIKSLLDIRPDTANLLKDGQIISVSPEEVKVGDTIVIKPGERIALDGVILEGSSSVDTSALTGESIPRDVGEGEEVLSGSVNLTGVLNVEVRNPLGQSAVSKILDLVENASSKKARSERFITVFARYYTPVVVGLAIVLAFLPPLILPGEQFGRWLYRALTFLVISCPCALVISIPLSFFCGIGAASGKGILIKGGNYLEVLSKAETVVFDKTGTLTKGSFSVGEINSVSMDKAELLKLFALAEHYSHHPIARAIKAAYGKDINPEDIGDYKELAGLGVEARIGEHTILAGNDKLLRNFSIPFPETHGVGTYVHMAKDGEYAGNIMICDTIKDDSPRAIAALRNRGIKNIVMLTGDSKQVAEAVGKSIGIDHVYANLLPEDKVQKAEQLLGAGSPKGKLIFVGDGINDAPVLARADIGVAMGGIGSDAAIEAADVVIMTDQPSKIAESIALSKKTMRIVRQNIILSLGIKAAVLVLGALGLASMWSAVFADVGVAALAILNAARLLRK